MRGQREKYFAAIKILGVVISVFLEFISLIMALTTY